MKELKVKVWNYKNVVLFEVLEMDKKILAKDKLGKTYFEDFTDWSIMKGYYTYINFENKEIYIGTGDTQVTSCTCESEVEAEDTVECIETMFKKFNESIKEILTDKEKEYLNVALYPFKDSIIYIKLYENSYEDAQFIRIEYNYKGSKCFVDSQYFECDKYFSGMELDKEYTLKDLGLE